MKRICGFYPFALEPFVLLMSCLHQRLHSWWQDKGGKTFPPVNSSLSAYQSICRVPLNVHAASESLSKHSIYLINLPAWLERTLEDPLISLITFRLLFFFLSGKFPVWLQSRPVNRNTWWYLAPSSRLQSLLICLEGRHWPLHFLLNLLPKYKYGT